MRGAVEEALLVILMYYGGDVCGGLEGSSDGIIFGY